MMICTLLAIASSASGSPRPLALGFGDRLFASDTAKDREYWLERATESGASWVRINVVWSKIAPASPPAGFEAANPASPGYQWKEIDDAVRDASAHHLKVMLTLSKAPTWAEGPNRPPGTKPGAWDPQPAAFGAFGHALAERYDGAFPDPVNPGATLPRVQDFDSWNEPNLVNYLAPQVSPAGELVGPSIYRKMLNRFYEGVKQVQPDATVLGSSFAPFGATDGTITPPVLFLRNLLCLKGSGLTPTACPEKTHIDALSTHPIQVGPPTESAPSPFDVTTPDLGRLTKVARAAEKAGTVRSSGRIGLWVTEFWLDSSPPDPNGVPVAKQARWYQQDLYEYWLAGAEVAMELQLRDSAPGPGGYASTLQSGLYFLDGRPKPSQIAMHFPFVAHHAAGGRVSVWGIAPRAGTVRIQALRGGAWTTLAKVNASGLTHPFTTDLQMTGQAQLRAQVGGELSLPWKLG